MKKKKLSFFLIQDDLFLRDIIIALRPDYDIKFFKGNDKNECLQILHDTDIAFFEWCNEMMVDVSHRPKMCKYVCRLHSYEMFTPLPGQVDWNNIDKLVFVSPVCRDYTASKFGIRPDILHLIPNGVDTNKYSIPEGKTFNKKVAFIGHLNYKKSPELLLPAFKEIYDYDNSYSFHIAGSFQDERIQLYFRSMMDKMPFQIHFDGFVQDIPGYLKDKDFVISTSLFESFQYSLMEGMASGVFPLVHQWAGSEYFYPRQSLFTFPKDCANIVREFSQINVADQATIRTNLRKHVVDNFSFDKQISEIKKMLESL
jgi:glycosyltransferase involved in cell wall biosynthesis